MKDASSYRRDVDGLRAVAVLGVILYHGFPTVLPGGFVGVDVFFVISGFLISGIIIDDLRRGTFTFKNFYARRVRRIFPALVVVLVASMAAGAIYLLPREFIQLGRHTAAGALFVSNVALLREINYFDIAAELKPLIHLWSLAVEEQYYFVWPLALFVVRAKLKWGLMLIIGIGVASFALNIRLVDRQPAADFYLPFTRFWELMLGSALAYGQRWLQPRVAAGQGMRLVPVSHTEHMLWRQLLSFTGLCLLVLAFTLINKSRAFPGWWALAPTAGTAMIIAAGPAALVNRSVLSTRWIVLIGVISYPLYLWHWPLLAFGRVIAGDLSTATTLLLILSGFVLAWLTYRFLEVKIRYGSGATRPSHSTGTLLIAMCATAAVGLLAVRAIVRPVGASSALVAEIEAASSDWEPIEERAIHGDTDRTVLFFGDSHMQQYAPRVLKVISNHTQQHKSVEFITRGGCAPVPGLERRGQDCASFVRRGFGRASLPQVDTVIVAASWYGFITRGDYRPEGRDGAAPLLLLDAENQWAFDAFEDALLALTRNGKKVVVILSSPRGEMLNPRSWVDRSLTGKKPQQAATLHAADLRTLVAPIDDKIRRIAQRVGATVIAPPAVLCSESCPALDEAGRFIYTDDSHLRASFVRERWTLFDQYLMSTSTEVASGTERKIGS